MRKLLASLLVVGVLGCGSEKGSAPADKEGATETMSRRGQLEAGRRTADRLKEAGDKRNRDLEEATDR